MEQDRVPFNRQYEYLSNFYLHPFVCGSLGTVRSSEHAFQALKTTDPVARRVILDTARPADAKRLGRALLLRPGWDEGLRDTIMFSVLCAKFLESDLTVKLHDLEWDTITEWNYWHDNYWGSCLCHRCGATSGRNTLGKMLMLIRRSIQTNDYKLLLRVLGGAHDVDMAEVQGVS